MLEVWQLEFMQNALAAGVLVSIACGIVGTLVTVNRIVFISGGIVHAAYGGIGLGYFFRFDPVWGAIGFSLVAGLVMGAVQRKTRQRADTIIGVIWAIGMAVGIILIDLSEGYKGDLMSYLFGSILTVPRRELVLLVVLDACTLLIVTLLYKELLAISFDETFATVRNVPVDAIYMLLMCAIAVTVVMLMQVVGLIMVVALLTIPAAIAELFVKDIKWMMLLASLFGIVFNTAGLWLSYSFNLTSGATIILVAGAAYLAALAAKPLVSNHWP